jgi:hypothetical protein
LRRRCRLGHSAAAEGLDVDLRDGDLRDGKLSDGEAPVRPVRHRVSKVRCSS